MEWLGGVFQKYPELAVYLAIGLGYFIGGFKFRGFSLGPVTGSLLVGVLLGNLFKVPVSSTAKSILFLMFLFGIGYSVGPKFFKTMKGEGLRWAALGIFCPVVGLATAYVVARILHLELGFAGGLVSGALTESPAIGTATEAIKTLGLPDVEQTRLISQIAVADAVCYIFGAFGVIWFCGTLGPRLLRLDLRAEAEKLEAALGISRVKAGVVSAWRAFEVRAYRLDADSLAVGKTVTEAERLVPDARIFVLRIRRDCSILEPAPDMEIRRGDIVAVSGRREVLVEILGKGAAAEEIEDKELLDIPTISSEVFVTGKRVAGRLVGEIAHTEDAVRGVFLRGITRGDQDIPVASTTVIERGDIVRLTGPEPAVERAARIVGEVIRPTDVTDYVTLGIAIFLGALVGGALVIPLGGMRIAVGTSIGTLLAGLLVGWGRSVRPLFGRIPDAAISMMSSLGLAAFVAMVGLMAGPVFMNALRAVGFGLVLGGAVVTLMPLVTGLYFGRYVLKLNPLLLLGGLAGAQTMTPGLAAVQERSGSPIAVFGYSGAVAFGHILLTTWGTVIVWLMS